MTVGELKDRMDCVEFHWWGTYFTKKAQAEQAAIEKAKSGRRRR